MYSILTKLTPFLFIFSLGFTQEPRIIQTSLESQQEAVTELKEKIINEIEFEIGSTIFVQDQKKIPIQQIRFSKGPLPEGLLDAFNHSHCWELLTQFFKHSESPSQRLPAAGQWNDSPLRFEWILPPARNYHSGSLHFYLLIRRESKLYMYFKAIFPTREGFYAFEILGEHNDSTLTLAKQIAEGSSVSEEFEPRNDGTPPFRTSRWEEILLLPSDREKTPSRAVLQDHSFLQKNRKSAGMLFLVLSIAFFLFIAPRLTK